jgi:hypothetical protein
VEVKITIWSSQLTKERLKLLAQTLIQSIRDCEQGSFPDKEISILVEIPELTAGEVTDILNQIKPRYAFGPITLFYHQRKEEKL